MHFSEFFSPKIEDSRAFPDRDSDRDRAAHILETLFVQTSGKAKTAKCEQQTQPQSADIPQAHTPANEAHADAGGRFLGPRPLC